MNIIGNSFDDVDEELEGAESDEVHQERYAQLRFGNDEFVVYDRENYTAYVQCEQEDTVDLSEIR